MGLYRKETEVVEPEVWIVNEVGRCVSVPGGRLIDKETKQVTDEYLNAQAEEARMGRNGYRLAQPHEIEAAKLKMEEDSKKYRKMREDYLESKRPVVIVAKELQKK